MVTRIASFLLVIIAMNLLLGCKSSSQLRVELVYQGQQCGSPQTELRLLRSEQEMRAALAPKALALNLDSKKALALPQLAWQENYYVYVSIGTRPSSGYAIAVDNSEMKVSKRIAQLPLVMLEPAKDSAQATVVTQPCAVVAVPIGDYAIIAALDMQLSVAP